MYCLINGLRFDGYRRPPPLEGLLILRDGLLILLEGELVLREGELKLLDLEGVTLLEGELILRDGELKLREGALLVELREGCIFALLGCALRGAAVPCGRE